MMRTITEEQKAALIVMNDKIALEEVKAVERYEILENEVKNKVNELSNLLRSAEYQLKLQEMVKEFPEISFDIRKTWNEGGVRIFNSVFSKENGLDEIFCLDIYESENMGFSIDTGIWGVKNYKNLTEEIVENTTYPLSKSYERTIPNTEIIQDVLKRLSYVLRSLKGKV